MNAQPRQDHDPHNEALQLEGLEGLLDRAHVALTESDIREPEPTEAQTVIRLLAQLQLVTELVKDTGERLSHANERLASLSTIVNMQSKQMEVLSHYQAQASRVVDLESQLGRVVAENNRLKRSWWRQLIALFKGSY